MAWRRVPFYFLLVCLLCCGLTSCWVRKRLIVRTGGKTTQPLQVADQNSLLQSIARQYNAVRDFSATVDMVPALGSAEKNKITEYKDVRAYILFRKPATIRIIGLYPVVRSKAFDMTSNGSTFKVFIPSKSLFIEGKNNVIQPSQNKLENLRPGHFIDALLVRPVDTGTERILMENLTDEDEAVYILHVVHERDGQLLLARTIWFNRINLQIMRQLIFDEAGNILTDARYSEWRAYDNIAFPKHVEINRPRDEYGVVIDIVKMDINKGLADDRFILERPEGTTLRLIGQPGENPAPAPSEKGKTITQ